MITKTTTKTTIKQPQILLLLGVRVIVKKNVFLLLSAHLKRLSCLSYAGFSSSCLYATSVKTIKVSPFLAFLPSNIPAFLPSCLSAFLSSCLPATWGTTENCRHFRAVFVPTAPLLTDGYLRKIGQVNSGNLKIGQENMGNLRTPSDWLSSDWVNPETFLDRWRTDIAGIYLEASYTIVCRHLTWLFVDILHDCL